MGAIQKMLEQHHVTKEKTPLINYAIGDQKSLRRKKIHSITLELEHVIIHYDVRKGVCVTNLNAREKGLLRTTAEI